MLRTSTVLIYVKLNCSYSCELQLFLLLRTPTVLIYVEVNCSYCCELQLFLLRRTRLFLLQQTQLFLLCLTKTVLIYVTVSCIKSLHNSLALGSALLCNSEIPLRILILWLCLPNILKRVVRFSWYLVLYKFIHYIRNCTLSLK